MPTPLVLATCSHASQKVFEDLLTRGSDVVAGSSQSTGAKKAYKEIRNYLIRVESPRERLTYGPRKIHLPRAVARFVWMMAASDRLADIGFWEPKVRYFTDDGISVPGSNYGQRMLQPRPGLNQLAGVINRLRDDSSSRRGAIAIYHPEDAVRDSRDIPCAFGIFYHIREDRLHATTVMRSNAAYNLLPYNFFEFSLVAEVVAAELGVELGCLDHFAASMHLYEQNIDKAREVVEAVLPEPVTPVPKMPSDPSPLLQVRRLAELEAELRHGSAGLSSANVEEWMDAATASEGAPLHAYWTQLYYLLLDQVSEKKGESEAQQIIRARLEEPYLSCLPPIATDDHDTEFPLFAGLEEAVPLDMVFPSKRLQSLRERVTEHEQAGNSVTWTMYDRLQERLLGRIAAREGSHEVTKEEFEAALQGLQGEGA